MSIEARRGCGYRKAGGLYIIGDLSHAIPARFLPFCIARPQSRALAWVPSTELFATCEDARAGGYRKFEKIGLMWVGKAHYTPSTFLHEAHEMGISKRVAQIPPDLKAGDPIALAHIAAMPLTNHPLPEYGDPDADENRLWTSLHCMVCKHVPSAKSFGNACITMGRYFASRNEWYTDNRQLASYGSPQEVAGVISLFLMRAIEVILPRSVAKRSDIRAACKKQGVKIVAVPDHDPDHVVAGWSLPRFLKHIDLRQDELPLKEFA